MSLSFKQIQEMLSANLRLVGSDIDAMRQELGKLRMVNYQLMSNMVTIVDKLKEAGIEIKFESIVDVDKSKEVVSEKA